MSSQSTGLRVASLVFALITIGHVARLIKHAQVTIGSHSIPLWFSVAAAIIGAVLSLWMWKLAK
jgi:hypothetical protein